MNKKFLNAILFGALAFSTVTFTSCKDYDDDIDSLNSRVDAVEKSLADLKTDFGNIAYVKAVTFANGILTVTPSNGTAVTYNIPTDTNTTYTLSVNTIGNKATITLTPSTGSAQTATVEFTDSKLDPSLFRTVEQSDGSFIVVYGNGDDAPKTGIVIPAPASGNASVSVQVKDETTGAILGWMVDGTKLNITDVLPITSFEYIPEAILADWGERVIVFHKDNYQPVEIKNEAVTPMKTSGGAAVINYLPNQATPQYHVNPSSATLAQLENEGQAVIKGTIVEKLTKAASPVAWSKTAVDKGIMTVTLEADPTAFVTDENKLDEIALQFTTTAGNSITTEYVGVINKSEKLALVLADKEVTATTPKDETCHFATTLAAAKNQKALVGADNKASEVDHLVQQVLYSEAVAGINLKTLVTTCNTANGHAFFDYAAKSDFVLSFEPIAYTVGETPQDKYMQLSDEGNSTFKAINYDLTESQSCIGKAPIVLAKLTDPNNDNAIVAAAYIKLLIVGDEAAPADDDIVITKNETVGLGCNTPNLTWSTNDQFMSTEVYTFKHKAEGSTLAQLSKEQFHLIYQLPEAAATENGLEIADGTTAYGTTKVSGDWTIKEDINTTDGKVNHKVTFTLTTTPLVKGKTYTVYAIYTKTDNKDALSNVVNNNMYPEKVMIAYSVKVDDINFTASIKAGNKIANYWNDNAVEIYCKTPGKTSATIDQDMLTNFEGHKVEFTYSSEFDATKYPSFAAANMAYNFFFSEDNLQKNRGYVKDAYDKEYQLFMSLDKTQLYAVAKGTTEEAKDANLVASLSGDNNETITYANTEVAKALLNVAPRGAANAFFAWLEVSYFNGCDLIVPVTDGKFKANFIRPVNAVANDAEKFTDGNNEGQCAIALNKLISFTDWRYESPLNSFASHLNYYKYYNVTKIALDTNEKIKMNLNRGHLIFYGLRRFL